jgi:hypothetical protein
MRGPAALSISVVAVSLPLLTGCFTGDGYSGKLASHDQKCEQSGFKQGTPEYANCRLEHARETIPRATAPAPD